MTRNWYVMIPPLFCISSIRIDQQANNNYIPLSTMHFFLEIHTVAETYSWFNCTFRRWVFPTLTPQRFPVSLLAWCTLKPTHELSVSQKVNSVSLNSLQDIHSRARSPSLHVPCNNPLNPFLSINSTHYICLPSFLLVHSSWNTKLWCQG